MVHTVVPAPASLAPRPETPFALTTATQILGEADAAAALRRLIAARTSGQLLGDHTQDGARTIHLTVTPGGPAESYRLTADATTATVTGADAAGLFYGVQTLGQLLTPAADGDHWIIPAVEIDDAPRFSYRGVMFDVARHFQPVDTVKAYIDRAAGLKFNHLHLHLTDDQGWRLEIASRPALTEKASGSSVADDPGGYYSQEDYREIVAYAASRHMTVVPEIDLPGHTHAVTLAYPELTEPPVLSDHIHEVVRDFGGGLPEPGIAYTGLAVGFSSLRIHHEPTYEFVADVLEEVAALTPGPYLHIGGDEALGTSSEDYAVFIERVTQLAAQTGKTPIAWHEAGAIGDRLAPGTIGQYWGMREPDTEMARKTRAFVRRGQAGGRLILSPADAIYLDMKYAGDAPIGLSWAGIVPLPQAYDWDPAEVLDGLGETDILGVEAPLWTETVRDLGDIDAMAFPRIAAAAEIAWSPARGGSDERTWDSFRDRVGRLAPLWRGLGIGFTPLPDIEWAESDATPTAFTRED